MGIPPSKLKKIELLAIQELNKPARRKVALAEIVKYWFENDREASFQNLAGILEKKMEMTLDYTVDPLQPMEDDLIATFLDKLEKPLPDLGVLADELCVQNIYCRLPENEKNMMNVIKHWIDCFHVHKCMEHKQCGTWGSLEDHMQNAIKKKKEQRKAAEDSLIGIIIL